MDLLKLERQVRFLKIYAAAATLVCAVFVLTAFTFQTQKQKFGEIDVERINVVEKDGSTRLVISNRERSPGPIQRGKPFGYPVGGRAGMIFYNDEGTEDGGLIFNGKKENGQTHAVGSLTFDQYEQDQTIAFNTSMIAASGVLVWQSTITRPTFRVWSSIRR